MAMDRLLLITGAGASFDVIAGVPVAIDSRPLLTHELFTPPITFGAFHFSSKCLAAHPLAYQVATDFNKRFSKDIKAIQLEDYLSGLKNSTNILLKREFWSVPPYFYELFKEISYRYLPASSGFPSNYYSLITKLCGSKYKEIIWLNLNYDLLADFAIMKAAKNKLDNLEEYLGLNVGKDLTIQYTKPHGSIDWFKEMPGKLRYDTIKQDGVPDHFENVLPKEIVKARVGATIQKEPHWYPALTAPVANEKEFIYQKHIELINPILKETTSLLCIGFSALDEDILKLIKINIPTIKTLKIVNGNATFGNEAYENLKRYGIEINELPGEVVFDGSFSHFIYTGIDQWLSNSNI